MLITPEILRSVAVVPSSATVNNLEELFVSATLHEMDAPYGKPLFETATSPPRVRVPVPVIVDPGEVLEVYNCTPPVPVLRELFSPPDNDKVAPLLIIREVHVFVPLRLAVPAVFEMVKAPVVVIPDKVFLKEFR